MSWYRAIKKVSFKNFDAAKAQNVEAWWATRLDKAKKEARAGLKALGITESALVEVNGAIFKISRIDFRPTGSISLYGHKQLKRTGEFGNHVHWIGTVGNFE